MARIQYVVEPNGAGAWKISYAEKEFGPYRTQGEAISAAIDAAHRASAENSEARAGRTVPYGMVLRQRAYASKQ